LNPICGDHVVNVNHALGKIPNASGYSGITTVTCTITSMTVSESLLNFLGSDDITFVGTNIPRGLSQTTVTITFDDTQGTLCVPKTLSNTQLICTTNAFSSSDTSTTMTPVIVING
jgi:hypothetical protein